MPWRIVLTNQSVKELFATGLCAFSYRTMRGCPTGLCAEEAPQLPDYADRPTKLCVSDILTD